MFLHKKLVTNQLRGHFLSREKQCISTLKAWRDGAVTCKSHSHSHTRRKKGKNALSKCLGSRAGRAREEGNSPLQPSRYEERWVRVPGDLWEVLEDPNRGKGLLKVLTTRKWRRRTRRRDWTKDDVGQDRTMSGVTAGETPPRDRRSRRRRRRPRRRYGLTNGSTE